MTPETGDTPNQKEKNMKSTQILIGLMAAGSIVMAGSVTIPHTFSPNTTAKASEVNANFSAVKTAVDGNAADIATKQKKITGECAVGSSIRKINPNGTVECEDDSDSGGDITSVTVGNGLYLNSGDGNSGDVKIMKTGGYYSMHPSDFSVFRGGCKFFVNSQQAIMQRSTQNNCRAFAPVHIPSESKIVSLSCRVTNNTDDNVEVKLYKQDHNDEYGHISDIATLTWQNNSSSVIKSTYLGTPEAIDNYRYSYSIVFEPKNTDTDNIKIMYWCRIGYSFD